MTIESGDIFQGLTISWTPRDLDHYPLLAVHWSQPVYAWEYWVRDAMLFQTNGDTLFLPDAVTVDGHFDCFDLSFICRCPDTAEVLIDSPFDIEVTCFITAMGYIGTNIEINDERGWVTAWNPGSVEWNYCSICPWFKTYVMISGFVPASTPAHSVSRLTVYPTYGPFVSDSTSLYLKAIPSTGIKSTSWGAVKSRFMNGE